MKAGFVKDEFVVVADDQATIDLDEAVTWVKLPKSFNELTQAPTLVDGKLVIVSMDVFLAKREAKKLRIMDYLKPNADVLAQDFSLLPVRKLTPKFDRGRKVSAKYVNDKGETVVQKHFHDVVGPTGALVALRVEFEWLTHAGNVGLAKSQIVKEYSPAESETVMRERRERQIDYLIASAKGTPIAPVFHAIFNHFQTEISQYIGSDDEGLAKAITEGAAPVDPMLDTVIGGNARKPYTVRMAILKEITGDKA